MNRILNIRAGRFFWRLTAYPKAILFAGIILIFVSVSFLPSIVKDTRTEAFIPQDDPVIVYRDQVEATFGLNDPMVIAIFNDGPDGVFTPHTLNLVAELTELVADIDGIDYDRITSLATENDVFGTEDGMIVDPFFEYPLESPAEARHVKESVMDFPLYVGSLVGREGNVTLIVAELLVDDQEAPRVYEDLLALVDGVETNGEEIHVAGQGAVSGYMAYYIDKDAKRLNPLAGLVITLILIVAYRTVRGAVLPNLMVMATVSVALGGMAALGVPFFVITNALPIILIAIAVADGLHILAEYYDQLEEHPQASQRELVVRAMVRIWRPVTITSLTTAAGFLSIYLASYMPPMKYFGLFAMVGVITAWVFAVTVLPAGLSMLKPRASKAYRAGKEAADDGYTRFMMRTGKLVLARPKTILAATVLVAIVGVMGARQLEINENQINNFQDSEPIVLADELINKYSDGTTYLDIVVETPDPEGLFDPEKLRKIEAMQVYMESVPHVKGSTSIVDFLKQMNRAMNEDRPEAYELPNESALVAQYFLLYSASGDPTDFEEYIDYDYRLANVRLRIDSGLFTDGDVIMDRAQAYLDEHFRADDLSATLSGSLAVNNKWVGQIEDNHFKGVFIALIAVLFVAMLSFRSVVAGILAITPVITSILLIYAVMGATGIWLSVGTSMFAAIAIGVGIDFAVHTIDRLMLLIREQGKSMEEAFTELYASTGRALLFNFAAVALGFGVLATSAVPTLIRFGVLVAVGVSVAFIASLTSLPALIHVTRPAFLGLREKTAVSPASSRKLRQSAAVGVALFFALGVTGSSVAQSQALPSGDEIARHINDRDEGKFVTRHLKMTLIDKRGKSRVRETQAYRKYFGDEKRTVLFYESPTNIKGTGFLTYDYENPDEDDDQWLYLPALRKTRRISAGDRGDYFLGTDLTFEDIKLENKVSTVDYTWKTLRIEDLDGREMYVVEATTIDSKTAKELGYGKSLLWVDPEIWIVRKREVWDPRGRELKTVTSSDISEVQGIWTVHRIDVQNHKTGHRTVFEFTDVDYVKNVGDDLFTERALRRGR